MREKPGIPQAITGGFGHGGDVTLAFQVAQDARVLFQGGIPQVRTDMAMNAQRTLAVDRTKNQFRVGKGLGEVRRGPLARAAPAPDGFPWRGPPPPSNSAASRPPPRGNSARKLAHIRAPPEPPGNKRVAREGRLVACPSGFRWCYRSRPAACQRCDRQGRGSD